MALYNNCLFPVNMPDPAWIRPGSGQRAARIGPDPIFHIRFAPGSDAFFFFFRHRKCPGSSLSDPMSFLYIWPVLDIDAIYPDLLGLKEARSDPSPARQVEISSGRHFCSGPMVIVRQDLLTTTRSTQPVYFIFR